jgi:hypothetical protein
MARVPRTFGCATVLAALVAPTGVSSQAPEDHAAHSHAGAPVECTTLAAPPWTGLPDSDRTQVERLQASMSALASPEAARAAGFVPVLGDIPGMGVHYVHAARARDGIDVDEPDHLLFAEIDGRDELVGVAYAFRDTPDTDVPIPFESDLAHWHDHPQFAPEGQTLHMLHVWFVPSSNGPFAGLNFWLPFRSAGIEPPSACWMADEEDAQRIRIVSFALAPRSWGDGGARVVQPQADRADLLGALDAAAKQGDRAAWMAAAERFLADLTPVELAAAERQLRALTEAQMSSTGREGSGPPPSW